MNTLLLQFHSLKQILIFISLLFFASLGMSQELMIDLSINFPTATETDKTNMQQLEVEMENFLNSTKWTDVSVQDIEKIRGTMSINVAPRVDPASNKYTGDILINVVRPVYGTTYTTSILNFNDNGFVFIYGDGINLIKMNSGTFVDNISAVLSYYAYYIIGADRESFELGAGQPYFEICRDIANSVPAGYQSDKQSGWYNKGFVFNRNQLAQELNDPRLIESYQKAWYTYHLRGLDEMALDTKTGIAGIREGIESLKELKTIEKQSMLLQMFFDCKTEELVEIFSHGDMTMRKEVYDDLVSLSPTNRNRLEKIRSN